MPRLQKSFTLFRLFALCLFYWHVAILENTMSSLNKFLLALLLIFTSVNLFAQRTDALALSKVDLEFPGDLGAIIEQPYMWDKGTVRIISNPRIV